MKNLFFNISLFVLSLLFTAIVLEMGARVYYNEFSFHNFLLLKRDLFQSAYPSEFDSQLGWVPKKGSHPKNIWNTKVTILNDGIRSNGNKQHFETGERILAVGDSFTFGDQVSDNESWPSILEMKSKMKVINGGVFGYGIGQTFLRIQALASKYHPDIIIFSFIRDDIKRSELSERTSVQKPYFKLSGDDIVLMNTHIQRQNSKYRLDIFRQVFGYSFFANILMTRAFPEYWLQGSWKSTRVHSNGEEVTCRIFEKLKTYAQIKKIKLYILVQYAKNGFEKKMAIVDGVITCIDQNLIELVDMRTSLSNLKIKNRKKYENLFQGHMTPEGNEFVASLLLKVLADPNGMTSR